MRKFKPISLKNFSIIMLIISLTIITITILETFKLEVVSNEQVALETNLAICELTANRLESSADYLSEQISYFAITKDMKYFNQYWAETSNKNRRFSAASQIADLNITNEEAALFENATIAYDQLSFMELHAMKLIVTALEIDVDQLPGPVKDYNLDHVELRMSKDQQLNYAYELIFGDDYISVLDNMNDNLKNFTSTLRERHKVELEAAVENTQNTIHFQRLCIVTLAIIFLVIFSSFYFIVIFPLSRFVLEMNHKKFLTLRGSLELQKLADAFNIQYNNVRLSEERFRMAASRMSQMIVEYDVKTDTVDFLTGKHIETEIFKTLNHASLEKWLSLVHPDDLPVAMDFVHRLTTEINQGSIEIRFMNLRKGYSGFRWYYMAVSEISSAESGGRKLIISLEDIDKQQKETLGLRYKAEHDLLTGLLNRITFENEIEYQLQDIEMNTHASALLLLDIDDFKGINDKEGHDVGDLALKKLAKALGLCFRGSDLIGRLGGDEFVIWMQGVSDNKPLIKHKIEELNRILKEMDQNPEMLTSVPISTSVGITFAGAGDTFTDVYRRADEALYHSKRNGKNRCSFYDDIQNLH